jgi:hypothetical protein
MKYLYLTLVSAVLLTACSKRDYYRDEPDAYDWMRTRERGVVAYVDGYTGNYIVDTYNGFAVIEYWGGITPREYDEEYAYFSNRSVQTIYNRQGNYFSKGRVVDSWLTWSDALYVLDEISYR